MTTEAPSISVLAAYSGSTVAARWVNTALSPEKRLRQTDAMGMASVKDNSSAMISSPVSRTNPPLPLREGAGGEGATTVTSAPITRGVLSLSLAHSDLRDEIVSHEHRQAIIVECVEPLRRS